MIPCRPADLPPVEDMFSHVQSKFAAVANQYAAQGGAEARARQKAASKQKSAKPDRFSEGKGYANAYAQMANKWG